MPADLDEWFSGERTGTVTHTCAGCGYTTEQEPFVTEFYHPCPKNRMKPTLLTIDSRLSDSETS